MKKIYIDYQSSNCKVAILENRRLVEFWVERESIGRLVGNIYKGKVTNVLPGMEFAFVNIGLERNGFLYAGDVLGCEEAKSATAKILKLKVGDELLVQVVKDQFGNKGARISMNITLPGRGLVLMPQIDYIGVSRKIKDENKKQELLEFIEKHKKEGQGYIVRTQAIDCTEEELLQEMHELSDKWEMIKEMSLRKPSSSLIYKEEGLAIRAVRDMLRSDVDEIIINNERVYQELIEAFPHVYNENPNLFKLNVDYPGVIADKNISKQILSLLEKKVVLENGAYLVIDRTEALTVIDVNTGKYVGERALEETVYETNRIAAIEIARQLRLRNIGGIIVVDFIDMEDPEHIQGVMQVLQQELDKDRIKTSLIDMTPLGLVEITRKKTRSMIEDVMLQHCPYCDGDGYLLSDEAVAGLIKNDIQMLFANDMNKSIIVRLAPSVFNRIFTYRIFEKECATIWANKRIYLIPDNDMHIEKYEIRGVNTSILDLPDQAKLLY